MGLSLYFSEQDIISSLRQQFHRDEQYRIDFRYWLNTLRRTSDGFVVQVENRRFLIHEHTGMVLKELV